MEKIVIAFDVDGTLIGNDTDNDMDGGVPVANERIRTLLVSLASFKNVEIVVWSGGGELYARQVCNSLGLQKYVNRYCGKSLVGRTPGGKHIFKPDFQPDIAIDDIQECKLGKVNLIVKEK